MPRRGGGGKFVKELNSNIKRWQIGELQQLFEEVDSGFESKVRSRHNF